MSYFSKNGKKHADALKSIRVYEIDFAKPNELGFDLRWKASELRRSYLIYPGGNFVQPQISIVFYPDTSRLESRTEQVFDLETTPCNLGGVRYWFICNAALGRPCGRRVGVLYEYQQTIACRHCHRLTYETRTMKKLSWPTSEVYRIVRIERRMRKLKKQIKRTRYANHPTKKKALYDQLFKTSLKLQGYNIK